MKMKSNGFDAVEGRPTIPVSNSYTVENLVKYLRDAGFLSIAEITYGGAVTPLEPDIVFRWLPKPGEKHYPPTPMNLDQALRTLIDSLGSNNKPH